MRYVRGALVRMGSSGMLATSLILTLGGCGKTANMASDTKSEVVISDTAAGQAEADAGSDATTSLASMSTSGVVDTTSLFTERDLEQTADLSTATSYAVSSGQDILISEEGTYVVSGEGSDVSIVVDADSSAKVQIVLDGVSISNGDTPAIYVKSADKVFMTTTEGSENKLEVTGDFTADGETNTDAVIFSKDDLVLNGQGFLQISSTGNGVTSKDDLKVTGGSYSITSAADALEANDAILVCDGDITISSQKDGLHAENDEDDTQGMVYICGGSFAIDAASDAIQATTYLQVDEGAFKLNAGEGLEGTYVQVNGGTLDINASDDGVNATTKSASVGTPTIEIAGGSLSITMAAGDTDALDANGNLVVSGGTIDINAQSAFDFDGTVSFTGGTVTVNGEQVSEITNSMMGGGAMGGMGHGPEGDMGPQDGMMPGGPRG